MKKLLPLLSLTFVFISLYETGYGLNLVGRHKAGTLEKDVERVQTFIMLDGTTQTMVWKLDPVRKAKNMKAVLRHIDCVTEPDTLCKVESPKYPY